MRIASALLFATALVAAGCSGTKTQNDSKETAARPAASADGALRGRVLERLDSGGYTYLRLSTDSGETWAAVPGSDVKVGDEVAVADPQVMQNFTSRTLERTFERIVFGTLTGGSEALPSGHPPVDGQAAAPKAAPKAAAPQPEVGEIDKAEGDSGRRVAEVFADRASLGGQTVAVRGQVVKYNAGILGANWMHLRDGSGSAEAGDNDLVVTTQDNVAVGEIVVIEGKLSLDRDFGAGYVYPVIIENAEVRR